MEIIIKNKMSLELVTSYYFLLLRLSNTFRSVLSLVMHDLANSDALI